MDIYLDANATTPVLAQARAAAMAAMADNFGNPSSAHGRGLQARALLDTVRCQARQVLGAPRGHLLFTSGATEGIQTAVLSALVALKARHEPPELLLYGATEHKAVPEALQHWNTVLGLGLSIQSIPVDTDGRHDLDWLRRQASRAGLVCTMAANNETGVVSDLAGIEAAMADSPALWLVDGVQALGKLALNLSERRIDYAPFSGHKLYAPKGIGLLYVREGAPFTPLLAGGGQEGALRSGTENMAGIAALGAVLRALGDGETFSLPEVLAGFRDRLAAALHDAFPGLVFNAPWAKCLPTTLNFSVPGVDARRLLEVFDAADVHVSGGSACSAAQAQPSHVLTAMGLPAWQTASAIRLSMGPAVQPGFIDEACRRIRACGDTLRANGAIPVVGPLELASEGLTRLVVDAACCYVIADADSRRCVVVDARPAMVDHLVHWIRSRGYRWVAVLQTRPTRELAAAAQELRAALPPLLQTQHTVDALGWPEGASALDLGRRRLTHLALPGPGGACSAYVLHDAQGMRLCFAGDAMPPGAVGTADERPNAAHDGLLALRLLARAVGTTTVLLPGHEQGDCYACTLAAESASNPVLACLLADEFDGQLPACDRLAAAPERISCDLYAADVREMAKTRPGLLVVDVRDAHEQRLGGAPSLGAGVTWQAVPLANLADALPDWLALPADQPVLFVCRSGQRSATAANALRRLGRDQSWSLVGGLAHWPKQGTPSEVSPEAPHLHD